MSDWFRHSRYILEPEKESNQNDGNDDDGLANLKLFVFRFSQSDLLEPGYALHQIHATRINFRFAW